MGTLELEQGSVVYAPYNGTSILTPITMTLSTLGVGLSTCAMILLILTACLFAEWRKIFKNQLLIQFMVSRFYYTFLRYFFDIRAVYNLCPKIECIIYLDEISMIYSEVALICWMFVFTRQMYSDLVTVFNTSRPQLWKVSVATWTIPAFFSGISFGIFRLQNGKELIFFFVYLALIKWPVLIANATVLIMILRSITKNNVFNSKRNKSNFRLVVVMNVLIWTFCLQQVFVDIYKLLFILLQWPSTILLFLNIITLYHCAFAISFWVLGNAETRKLWRKRCCNSKNDSIILSSENSSMSLK